MSPLVPCPSCVRHVRVSEPACPFCGASLPDLRSKVIPAARRRLDRLAAFTFAAGIAVTACGSDDDGKALKQQQQAAPGDDGGVQALYGAAPVDDGGTNAALYGMPADDAGPAPSDKDAGPKDDGGVQALYGLPAGDGGANAALYGLPP